MDRRPAISEHGLIGGLRTQPDAALTLMDSARPDRR